VVLIQLLVLLKMVLLILLLEVTVFIVLHHECPLQKDNNIEHREVVTPVLTHVLHTTRVCSRKEQTLVGCRVAVIQISSKTHDTKHASSSNEAKNSTQNTPGLQKHFLFSQKQSKFNAIN